MFLNLGCADTVVDGWVNVDRFEHPSWRGAWIAADDLTKRVRELPTSGTYRCDVLRGLPFADATFDGAVCNHMLQDVEQHRVVDVLVELRRLIVAGGALRVLVPSLAGAVFAWLDGERRWFPNAGETIDEAFVTYVSQNGATRSFFTDSYLMLLLARAGFERFVLAPFGESEAGIALLDSRQHESLIIEAT